MAITFDPAKDRINVAKHAISFARAADLEILAVLEDDRFDYGEARYRAWGLIDSKSHCLAFTAAGDTVHTINLRRAHAKEMKRHAP